MATIIVDTIAIIVVIASIVALVWMMLSDDIERRKWKREVAKRNAERAEREKEVDAENERINRLYRAKYMECDEWYEYTIVLYNKYINWHGGECQQHILYKNWVASEVRLQELYTELREIKK